MGRCRQQPEGSDGEATAEGGEDGHGVGTAEAHGAMLVPRRRADLVPGQSVDQGRWQKKRGALPPGKSLPTEVPAGTPCLRPAHQGQGAMPVLWRRGLSAPQASTIMRLRISRCRAWQKWVQ